MQRKLFHSVDRHAIKAEKYLDHATSVSKLVSPEVSKQIRALRKELAE